MVDNKMKKEGRFKRSFRQMRARLSGIQSQLGLADWWAVIIRILAGTFGSMLKLNRLLQYDKALSGKFAKKQLSTFWDGEKYDFNGIYLPETINKGYTYELYCCVKDVLGVYLYNNDDYSWDYVDKMDKTLTEGVYCYSKPEDGCQIVVSKGDTVLDLGAWMGDFSAYACKKGAIVYAFEPLEQTRNLLQKTVKYNEGSPGKIIIVPLGVGSENKSLEFSMNELHPGSSTFIQNDSSSTIKIDIVKLDDWVLKEGIKKIDFIKADIEGFERNMLLGATNILKNHNPILSLCTYHLPDDPEVMSRIILDANPDYKIIYRNMKLFAHVPK